MENLVKKTSSSENTLASQLNLIELDEKKTTAKFDYSSIRKKSILVRPTDKELQLLQSQINDLLKDGCGETFYDVGVGDDGKGLTISELDASAATLRSLAIIQNVDCTFLQEKLEGETHTAQYFLRKKLEPKDFIELRITVVGNVDSGKSTLQGVLIFDELDDGRGHARLKTFNHKHEVESGRTSSITYNFVGFDNEGNIVKPNHGLIDVARTCEKSTKVIQFIDLAGHERYLKTTVLGMVGHMPDFTMLMVGANAGIIGTAKEHLGLSLLLKIPAFVVITKIDMCPPAILELTLKLLVRVLKSPGCRKVPIMVKNKDDAIISATHFVSQRLCPVFQISNVNGENLDLLKTFLNLLNTRIKLPDKEPALYQIYETFSVPGVGTVVFGTVQSGTIRANDTLMLGPDSTGQFISITIKSVQRNKINVEEVKATQTATFALKKIKRSQIRRGMVMISQLLNAVATWEFDAEILILHHPITVGVGYQAKIYCGSVGQTATVIQMAKVYLGPGDKGTVKCRFLNYPEYIRPDQKVVIVDCNRTKAVGKILSVPPLSEQLKIKPKEKPIRTKYKKYEQKA